MRKLILFFVSLAATAAFCYGAEIGVRVHAQID